MSAAPQFFNPGDLVAVLTTQPLDRLLDYYAPEGGCHLGAFVEVPLGPRKVLGVVWGAGQGGYERSKIRPVSHVLDVAPMRDELRLFLQKAAGYTLTPMPAMLRLATRAPGLGDPPSMRKVYRRAEQEPDRATAARARVLAVFAEQGDLGLTLRELAELAGVSTSVIKGLVAQGVLAEEDSPRDLPFARLNADAPGKTLTEEQAQGAQALRAAVRTEQYGTTLLRGVTGSGKTEVYLEAVAETLRRGRQVLVLLPEIALTAEFVKRVEARFGARPAEWHSGATLTERRRIWRMVGQGQAQLVIGPRSALFLPFQNLGLIVVDEEHDSSYKQEEGVLYNARDMAVLRASLCGAQVVLASATPSLESWSNAQAGKYQRLDLSARFGPARLPVLRALDMRPVKLPKGRWISPELTDLVAGRVSAGEQALLFINRRGYAPITLCGACGHQIACFQCDARMVEHRSQNRLVCHQCGETAPIPSQCPACGAEDRLAPVGPGIERLTEEVTSLFPQARVAALSSDMFGTARALKAEIEGIAEGGADIILGTQLVAKGHNFPKLTLVGVIDADLSLQGSDLRAAERTFQLIRQVAGRAGRADKPGEAVLQTYQPDHPVIRAILAGKEEAFWQAEAAERAAIGMPPFGRLVGIILSGPEAPPLFDLGTQLARADAPLRRIDAQVLGPAPAPITRIRGRYRVRLLVKAPKGAPVQQALRLWLQKLRPQNGIRLTIDVDPQSFF